jgi:hypothetical protein
MGPRSRTAFVTACLAATALWACGQILNVDGIEIQQLEDGGGGSGGSVPPPRDCLPGAFQCKGAALQFCEELDREFRTVRVCSSAALCCPTPELCAGQPGCLEPACEPGEFRCQGEVLEACNAGQTGFEEVDRCASATQCNASLGRCTDQPCNATLRERQCNGPNQEECLPGQSSWTLIESCATHELCSTEPAASCAPADCRINGPASPPSPYQCVSGNLMRCNDGQTGWEFVETCLNTANCNALIDALVGNPYAPAMSTLQLRNLGCTAPGCTPGRYRCNGNQLLLCGANRTGYLDPIATCQSPRHCDASGGRCTLTPCSVGQHQCSGDEYQVCGELGWELEERCSPGAPCDAQTGCQETTCKANEYRCNDAQLERCNVARTGWIPVQTCESAGLCDVAAKRCEEPACLPNQARCTPAGVLERCNADRTAWVVEADCAALANLPAALGSGACDPTGNGQCSASAACAAGALRCNGAALERCRNDAWRPFERCETAAQCDVAAGRCQPAVCEPRTFRCVTPGNPPVVAEADTPRLGLSLEQCNETGTGFEPVRTCTPLELCDDTHGQCDICNPTRPLECADRTLLVCTADGQERTLYKQCTQGCVEAGTGGSNRTTCLEDIPMTPGN